MVGITQPLPSTHTHTSSQTQFQHQTSTLFTMTRVPIFPPPHATPWPYVSLLLRGIVAQAQVPLLTPSGPPPPLESPSHQEEKDGEVGGAIDWGWLRYYIFCYSLS